MHKEIGYRNEIPVIESVRFAGDNIIIHLIDGRKVTVPLSRFPDIQKLTPVQRRKYDTLAGMGLMFDDCDSVYHVSDFIGNSVEPGFYTDISKNKNVHSLVAEPEVKYKKVRRKKSYRE